MDRLLSTVGVRWRQKTPIRELEKLQKNPELAVFLLHVDALPKVAERLTLVLDPTVPPFTLLTNAPKIKPQNSKPKSK